MPSLTKGIPLSSINRSNLLISLIVFIVIIALFFIPEIISFQKGDSQTVWSKIASSDQMPRPVQKASLDNSSDLDFSDPDEPLLANRLDFEDGELFEDPSEQDFNSGFSFASLDFDRAGKNSASPLQAILERLDGSQVSDAGSLAENAVFEEESVDEVQDQDSKPGVAEEFRAALRGRRWANEKLERGVNRKQNQLEDVLQADAPLTWQILHHRTVRRILRTAQKEAMSLAKTLSENNVQSRYALQNFIGGVGRVLRGAQTALLAEQVPGYLAQLDDDVTQAFLREGVARANYLKWTDISLEPLTSIRSPRLTKQKVIRPFEPGMQLSWVRVRRPRTLYGNYNPKGTDFLGFKGFVTAAEVKKINVYRDGELFKTLRVGKRADMNGRRFFKVHQHKLVPNSLYTLEAVDVNGIKYSKSYAFAQKILSFPYGVNPKARAEYALPYQEFDPRLDRTFLVGIQRPGSSSGFFNDSQIQYSTF